MTVESTKNLKSAAKFHENVGILNLVSKTSKSSRNARKLHENIVLPVNLDAAVDVGHKAVKVNKHRDSFYEENHERHVQAYDVDVANAEPQVDSKYTNFLQKFLDFKLWDRKN